MAATLDTLRFQVSAGENYTVGRIELYETWWNKNQHEPYYFQATTDLLQIRSFYAVANATLNSSTAPFVAYANFLESKDIVAVISNLREPDGHVSNPVDLPWKDWLDANSANERTQIAFYLVWTFVFAKGYAANSSDPEEQEKETYFDTQISLLRSEFPDIPPF